jgi:hypothetical protein
MMTGFDLLFHLSPKTADSRAPIFKPKNKSLIFSDLNCGAGGFIE